jgi:hypothetical protein
MAARVLTTMVSVVTVILTQALPILGQGVQEQTDTSESLIEIRLARQGDANGSLLLIYRSTSTEQLMMPLPQFRPVSEDAVQFKSRSPG